MAWGGPFSPKDTPRKYHRTRTMDVSHTRLDIRVDIRKGTVQGTSTITFRLLRPVARVSLDAGEMTIQGVTLGGKALQHDHRGDRLWITLPANSGVDSDHTVRIAYAASPHKGLYFVRRDAKYPHQTMQAWTQGESELNRYWYPGYDYPDDRFTTEMAVTVRKPFLAIGNGKLLSVTDVDKRWHTFHFKQSQPHVNYLVSLVAGDYEKHTLPSKRVPLEVFVPRRHVPNIEQTFGQTDHMMAFFEELIGMPYPYAKYAQTVVTDFLFGGMENITATTLTERCVHDERGHLDYQADPLVAHELAHQWYGNLITCKSWAHLWLNEGFATYFESLYMEATQGKDAFDNDRFGGLGWYKSAGYTRPMNMHSYVHADDLFDGHTYIKGAWILHMLRVKLGDRLFKKAVRHYTKKHANGLVESDDLRQAFEEASGYQLQAFFEQWVERAGHPDLKVSWRWDALGKQVVLKVKQSTEQPYDIRVPVWVAGAFGERQWLVHVHAKEQSRTLTLPSEPTLVAMDPDGTVMADIEFDKPDYERMHQVQHGPTALSRRRAARSLEAYTGNQTDKVVQTLSDCVQNEKEFHAVRVQCARSLGDVDTASSTAALLAGLKTKDHRARRGSASALARPTDNRSVHTALRRVFEKDRSYKTAGQALKAYVLAGGKNPLGLIRNALKRDSHMERIRKAAVAALVDVGSRDAFELLKRETKWGRPTGSRGEAVERLGEFGSTHSKYRDGARQVLVKLLSDKRYWVAYEAIGALRTLGDPAAIPALKAAQKTAITRNFRRQCGKAVSHLEKPTKPSDTEALGQELDDLRQKTDRLNERLRTLEKTLQP